ncbi:MAG: hypothetical protein ACKVWR_12715 [Acidimicrobiales bacterium]
MPEHEPDQPDQPDQHEAHKDHEEHEETKAGIYPPPETAADEMD